MIDLLDKKANNLNLIRLLAATQVLVLHSFDWYHVLENTILYKIIWLFPGVIIFFAISGFLITKSFEESSLGNFFFKRVFRIYPALIVCVIVSLLILSYFNILKFNFDFLKYFIAQSTIFQFYVPESIHRLGLGHPNGALWTISIELQFYLLFGIMATISKWKNLPLYRKNLIVISLVILSSYINFYANNNLPKNIVFKLLFNSIFYHFTYFGIGILTWINFKPLKKILVDRSLFWLLSLTFTIGLIIFLDIHIRRYQFDFTSFIYLLLLICSIFSFAFSFRMLSFNILGKGDYSYGLYLYHCLVLNTFIQLQISFKYIFIGYILSICLSIFSWRIIERPALQFSKKHKFG